MSTNHDMIPAWVEGSLAPVEKMQVHREGLRHKAVSVFVMHRDKVLIQQRAMSKYHSPGLWANTCCTHPLWDEAPADCVQRRLLEELGIEGLQPIFRDQLEYRADVGEGLIEHELVDVFLADAATDLALALNPDEVMATKWVPVFELAQDVERHPERYTAWLLIYLREHSDWIFGSLVHS